MSGPFVLAIDQGTTNTKALLVAPDGTVRDQASVPNAVQYPRPGWAEQSAIALLEGVLAVTAEIAARLADPSAVAALAISNQRETIVLWEAATGRPIAPAITWQCRRSAPLCERLRAEGHAERIEALTGLALDPLFPAAKIAWLLDAVPGARGRAVRGELRVGTIDSWLLFNLTGGRVHATDHSNAARTQLLDITSLRWDEGLADLFGVPLALLPELCASDARFGVTAEGATALPAGIPINAMIGDSHAALYGHGVRRPGAVKATYGTGTSLMALTDGPVRSRHGLSTTIAWSTASGPVHALEGNISVSGQAAAFMADLLGMRDVEALSDLALSVPDSNGVSFVPALVGLGAPHWVPDARGTITGLALGIRPAHLARAALEAIAFQIADVLSAMESDTAMPLDALRADGGASRNAILMQFQADIVGKPVTCAAAPQVSALGAAALAFSALGHAMPPVAGAERYDPLIPVKERTSRLSAWHRAIAQTLCGLDQRGEPS